MAVSCPFWDLFEFVRHRTLSRVGRWAKSKVNVGWEGLTFSFSVSLSAASVHMSAFLKLVFVGGVGGCVFWGGLRLVWYL